LKVRLKIEGEYVHTTEVRGSSLFDCLKKLAERGDKELQQFIAREDELLVRNAKLAGLVDEASHINQQMVIESKLKDQEIERLREALIWKKRKPPKDGR